MHSRRLVRHFITQFVETDSGAEGDSHQTLALVAAGVITIPLFATVFMSMRYLTRPLQAAGWTETAALEDQITFCATSMLVAAAVAAIEWDALALGPRDSMILGVLPVRHRDLVRAKIWSLLVFVGVFVTAIDLLPTLIHPIVTMATLPVGLAVVPVLVAAHAVSTAMAAAFGFASVVALRETLRLVLGPSVFRRMSDTVRSAVLLALLLLLAVAPARLLGNAGWMLDPAPPPLLLRPVGWFVAVHASVAGRVLQRLPERPMPAPRAAEERRLRTRYERNLARWTASAAQGAIRLSLLLVGALTLYLWNARRLHVLVDDSLPAHAWSFARLSDRAARALILSPPLRAGFLLLFRTMRGAPVHRLYLLVALAAGLGCFLPMAPSPSGGGPAPVSLMHLAAQTILLTALVASHRAAIRTAADELAVWVFGVADSGHMAAFRNGVRLGALAATALVVALLAPLHAAAWGAATAAAHAVNGMAIGWLLVETVSAAVERPLVVTIPSNDGLNTVGAVFLGALVIGVFVLAGLERSALGGAWSTAAFAGSMLMAAAGVHHASERGHRTVSVLRQMDRLTAPEA